MRTSAILVCLLTSLPPVIPSQGRADEVRKGDTLVHQILQAESISELHGLSELLGEYPIETPQVERLIDAARETESDMRRVELWHAIRYSRSEQGRRFLMEALPASSNALRIEFIQSLFNPAPFDLPVLIAVYESGERDAKSDEATLQEFFARFALTRWYETRLSKWPSTSDSTLYHRVNTRRQVDADAAQLRLLHYLVLHGHDFEVRLAAFDYKGHPWFSGFDANHRGRLAEQLLETAKHPHERGRAVVALRSYLPPSRFLRSTEPLEVRLRAIDALEALIEDAWSSTAGHDVLRQVERELLPLAQLEDQRELREAAAKLLQRIEIRYKK